MNEEFLKSFDGTREAGAIASGTLDELNTIIKPGVTTEKIDKICYEYINDNGAVLPTPTTVFGTKFIETTSPFRKL